MTMTLVNIEPHLGTDAMTLPSTLISPISSPFVSPNGSPLTSPIVSTVHMDEMNSSLPPLPPLHLDPTRSDSIQGSVVLSQQLSTNNADVKHICPYENCKKVFSSPQALAYHRTKLVCQKKNLSGNPATPKRPPMLMHPPKIYSPQFKSPEPKLIAINSNLGQLLKDSPISSPSNNLDQRIKNFMISIIPILNAPNDTQIIKNIRESLLSSELNAIENNLSELEQSLRLRQQSDEIKSVLLKLLEILRSIQITSFNMLPSPPTNT